jgi:hypothetical protein
VIYIREFILGGIGESNSGIIAMAVDLAVDRKKIGFLSMYEKLQRRNNVIF